MIFTIEAKLKVETQIRLRIKPWEESQKVRVEESLFLVGALGKLLTSLLFVGFIIGFIPRV